MATTEELYTRIETRDNDRRVFVDKYDDNEVWLSLQLNGGGSDRKSTRLNSSHT